MPTTAADFANRIETLKVDLVIQGRRVQALIESAFDAVFTGNAAKSTETIAQDDAVDIADVAFEKQCVDLLTEAARGGCSLEPAAVRAVLTFAKINNELERIADAGVDVAEYVRADSATHEMGEGLGGACPQTFRMMANSVVGIIRDTNTCVERGDARMAKMVLQSQHAVTAFKSAILKDAEQRIAKGTMNVDFAFRLHEIGSQCELMADHCTNIAEQVIYAATGAIVRHLPHEWVEVQHP
jgi:phosphate transport system protein